jgi:hypothetical protein
MRPIAVNCCFAELASPIDQAVTWWLVAARTPRRKDKTRGERSWSMRAALRLCSMCRTKREHINGAARLKYCCNAKPALL